MDKPSLHWKCFGGFCFCILISVFFLLPRSSEQPTVALPLFFPVISVKCALTVLTESGDVVSSWYPGRPAGLSMASHVLLGYSDKGNERQGQRDWVCEILTKRPKTCFRVRLVNLTLTSLYIRRELAFRMKNRLWKLLVSSKPRILRSSLNFIVPCFDLSVLVAGGQNDGLMMWKCGDRAGIDKDTVGSRGSYLPR